MVEIIGIKLSEIGISPNELQVLGKYTLQDILNKKIEIINVRVQSSSHNDKVSLFVDYIKKRKFLSDERGTLIIKIIETDENKRYIKQNNLTFKNYINSKIDILMNDFFLKLINSNSYNILDKAA